MGSEMCIRDSILLCGGHILGPVGIILGIPGYAILKVLVSHLYLLFKRRYNKYYGEDAGEYDFNNEEKELSRQVKR